MKNKKKMVNLLWLMKVMKKVMQRCKTISRICRRTRSEGVKVLLLGLLGVV